MLHGPTQNSPSSLSSVRFESGVHPAIGSTDPPLQRSSTATSARVRFARPYWVVIAAPEGATVTIADASPTGCIVASAGTLEGTTYEARRCPLDEGAHRLSGTEPFGIVAYGYGNAGSYAFAGGADVERIYEVPPLR